MNRGTSRLWSAKFPATVILACLVASMIVAGTTASVANAQPEAEHCLNPAGGDLNEFYGISDQIVAPFCPVANAGQPWIVTSRWFMIEEFEAFPDGFEPAGDTPLEDFIAKFLGVTYVIDAGTKFEQSTFLPNNGDLFTTLEVGDCRFCVLVSPNPLGSLHPLSIGLHTVDLYWSFGALHCDGGGDINENCLAPGEHLFQTATFEVVPEHFGGPPPRESAPPPLRGEKSLSGSLRKSGMNPRTLEPLDPSLP